MMKDAQGKKRKKRRITLFLQNTSFHGFHYMADQQASKFERLFWLMVCGWCLVGMYFLFDATWSAYKSSPISFVSETTYLNWNTTFPAVAVCEAPSDAKVEAFAEYINGEGSHGLFTNFLNELFLYSGCQFCESQCPKQPSLCQVDINTLVNQYFAPCDQLLTNCRWKHKKIDCCSHFKFLMTQLGPCYIFNSMQTNGSLRANLHVTNRETGPGTLQFELEEKADVSILSTEEVPFINRPLWQHRVLESSTNYTARIQVIEIANDPLVREVGIDQRFCRFFDEGDQRLSLYRLYSFSTCVIDCIAQEQFKLCGCNHHFLPVRSPLVCNVSGLACLNQKWDWFSDVQILEAPFDEDAKLTCDCLPSCTEAEFELVMEQETRLEGPSSYTLTMESLPTSRYIRNVVRTPLDLVVSLGGAAGLFLGASLVSVVEIIYYSVIG